MIVRDSKSEPERRGERRLEEVGLAREQPADGKPELLSRDPLAVERSGLIGVPRNQHRADTTVERISVSLTRASSSMNSG